MIKAEWVCGVPYGAVPFATTFKYNDRYSNN